VQVTYVVAAIVAAFAVAAIDAVSVAAAGGLIPKRQHQPLTAASISPVVGVPQQL